MIRKGKYHAPQKLGGQAVTADTISDDELDDLMAKAGGSTRKDVSRATSAPDFALTDYAGEDKRGPVTGAQQDRDRRLDAAEDITYPAGADGRGRFPGDTQGTPEEEARNFAPFALGMLVPGMAGPAMRALGAGARTSAAVGGAAGGAVQTAAGGGSPSDILTATMLGAGGGAITAHGGRAPRAPLSQAEVDAAALKAVPDKAAYKRPDLPKGSRGTEQMATDAESAIRQQLQGRKVASGLAMDDADAAFADLPPVPTDRAIEQIQNIRQRTQGGAGPTLDSDPVLARQQRQLTSPNPAQQDPEFSYPGAPQPAEVPERIPQVSPAQLRNIQRALTEEAGFARGRGATQAEAQLQQGAGVLSRTAREHDTSGDMGRALDAYGAEEDALSRGNELLYGRRGSQVPDEQTAIDAGRGRLGRAGQVTADDAAGSHANERHLNEIGEVEPVAKDFISQIRARNTSARRGMFTLPNLLTSNPLAMAGRTLQHNASNMAFKLAPPRIDASGMVAGREASNGAQLAIPLELQLLMQQQEQRRRNAGQ